MRKVLDIEPDDEEIRLWSGIKEGGNVKKVVLRKSERAPFSIENFRDEKKCKKHTIPKLSIPNVKGLQRMLTG